MADVPDEPAEYWDEEILAELDRRQAPRSTALPPRVEAWRHHTVSGAVLTGIALGLQEVFQPPREPVAIVSQVPGDPPGPPGPVQVQLDPDDPAACTVVVRAWMIEDQPAAGPDVPVTPPAGPAPLGPGGRAGSRRPGSRSGRGPSVA